jgi:tetratricopeptide (TPR) repeat protein
MRLVAAAAALALLSPLYPIPTSAQPPTAPAGAAQTAASQDPAARQGDAAFGTEDWMGAVEHYRTALKLGSASPVIHFRLGYALHMLKRYEEALKHHLIGARIANRPLRIDALYNAACAHALLGRKEQALAFLRRAIDTGFRDLEQVAKDSDLDSLREDAEFKELIASIGKAPLLHEQLDFLKGTWEAGGGISRRVSVSLPNPASRALVVVSNTGESTWTGLLIPNAEHRTWVWVAADALGTSLTLTGEAAGDGGVQFRGRETGPAGPGAFWRITLTPRDGSIQERVEISEDDATWKPARELTLHRPTTPTPASP